MLKALRSHDPSLVDEATFKEKIKVFGSDDEPIKAMESQKKIKQIKIPNKPKKPFLTLSYCKI
ncbi:hypothetical protein HG569_03365 [Helicobacter pylori]|nr:hypothetical protein HG569_03365 [Helicobacter pylori]